MVEQKVVHWDSMMADTTDKQSDIPKDYHLVRLMVGQSVAQKERWLAVASDLKTVEWMAGKLALQMAEGKAHPMAAGWADRLDQTKDD